MLLRQRLQPRQQVSPPTVGPVDDLVAMAPRKTFAGVEGEDSVFVVLRFRSGAVAALANSVAAPGLPRWQWAWLTGTEGSLGVEYRGRALWLRARSGTRARVFVRDEGLARDARYPASRWLHLGLVAVLLLIESWANARFFSEASDFGLLGGFLGAFCVAAVNVGSGFATGWLVLPWLSYRSAVARACFSVAVLCMVAFAGALNVAAAAYRDQLAAGAVGREQGYR